MAKEVMSILSINAIKLKLKNPANKPKTYDPLFQKFHTSSVKLPGVSLARDDHDGNRQFQHGKKMTPFKEYLSCAGLLYLTDELKLLGCNIDELFLN